MKWLVTSTFRKNASGVANYLLPTKPRHDAVRIVVQTLPTKKKQGKSVFANFKQWSIIKSKKKIALTRISLPQAKLQSISASAGLPFTGIWKLT